jgi:beta-lactamase regulating signal transducer with metallopeptidase domain
MNTTETVFRWVLQTSWQAAVLAGVILLGQLLFRKRMSPGWRYALWCLLLVRLVLPVSLPSNLHLVKQSWFKSTGRVLVMPPVRDNGKVVPAEISWVRVAPGPAPKLDVPEPASSTPPAGPPAERVTADPVPVRWGWIRLASVIWLAGCGLLLSRLAWTNYRFHRRIQNEPQVSDPAMLREFTSCLQAFGLKQNIRLVQTSSVDSPAVCGLWRKSLLLPVGIGGRFTLQELRYILLHELAHIKRRDLELNWLAVVLQILHWFNPIIWFAFGRMRADRELATDALALSRTERPENTPYGETIIKLAEWLTGRGAAPALVGIAEDKKEIQRRILMIARAHGRKSWPLVSAALLLVVAGFAATDLLQPAPEPESTDANDVLGEAGASAAAKPFIARLKEKSRWTFGPKAMLFGDEDGEVSGGLVRSVQIRNYAMTPNELTALAGPSASGVPSAPAPGNFVQWNFTQNLASTDGRIQLVPKATTPAESPDFVFVETTLNGDQTTVLRFSAGTCFELVNPFKDPVGRPLLVDYTVIMDVMFAEMKSRWAALWQTDPSNTSDAEWLISTEKGIGITDTYGGRVPEGEWHRLALVVRGSEALFTSFVDGQQVQQKFLDVKDEYYNRRLDQDVLAWTDTFAKLRDLDDPTAATAVRKFNTRLENGARAARAAATVISQAAPVPTDAADQIAGIRAWAAQQATAALVTSLKGKSRWTLGPKALLFADENGENAGGLVDAVQVRDYVMADDEVARLEGRPLSPTRDAQTPPDAQIAEWDFNGNLESATGGTALVLTQCAPAAQPELQFVSRNGEPGSAEVARFSRGTCFELKPGFSDNGADSWQLNYTVIMDVRFDERPVGWVSLWQNDARNVTDADWFLNKKGQLGIRDFYGGSVEDRTWNRLALVVDGRNGTISHFVNGQKVRTKSMVLEDEYGRRGGAERDLNFFIALAAELSRRSEPAAADVVSAFTRRMHNHPDPENASRYIPLQVVVTSKADGTPIPQAIIDSQTGESNEDWLPVTAQTDGSGGGRIDVQIPIAERIHLTARAKGYSAASVTVPGTAILDGTTRTVRLDLARSLKIGGTVTDPDGVAVANAVVRIVADDSAPAVYQVRSWSELLTTSADGAWRADFVPANVQHLTILVYHPHYARQAFVVNRDDSTFTDLKNQNATLQLSAESK